MQSFENICVTTSTTYTTTSKHFACAHVYAKSAGLPACDVDVACSPHIVFLRVVLILPYVVVGSNLPTPRSTPAWPCTFCRHFDGCFRLFVVSAVGLLRRFFYPTLDPLVFVPDTFCTHNLLNIAFFQNRPQFQAFSKTLVYTHALV